jgi:hypothetical protein
MIMLSYLFTCSEGDFAGLQIEDDPTPRLLSRYISDTGLYVTLMATYKSGVFPSSYEILFPEQEEEACKMVEIALHAYAKQKDMPMALVLCSLLRWIFSTAKRRRTSTCAVLWKRMTMVIVLGAECSI